LLSLSAAYLGRCTISNPIPEVQCRGQSEVMILVIMQVCGFLGIICFVLGIGLILIGFLIEFPHFNSQIKVSQPTVAKLVYKSPSGFLGFLGLVVFIMFIGLIGVQVALKSLQSLVQPGLINTVTGSNSSTTNFMMLLISGVLGLSMILLLRKFRIGFK
jgi:hypothetical protein